MDFHEERKWKRAFASIYAKGAKILVDERKKKKKIDDLYKKCYSIYFTINHGNYSSEFSDDNKKNELNDYLKPKLNEYDNLEKELNNWKKQIKDLENKLKSNIKTEGIYINGFLDIFSLIQSIINNQEEKLKEMKLNNKHNNIQNMPNFSSLSDVAEMLKNSNRTSRENKNCTIIADKSNINYNQVNSNISEIINQVIEEFNIQVLKVEETNINNSFKQNSKISNNNNNINNNSNINNNINNSYINQNEINNNQNSVPPQNMPNPSSNSILKDNRDLNKSSISKEDDEFNDYEMKLNNGLNPSKLILNREEEINEENLLKSLQTNLEIENCFILPLYNFGKLINTTFNLNSVEYDTKNAYYKVFPMIENDEKKLASKKLLDVIEPSLPINNINKMKKNIITDEQSTRYDKLTPLQKLIILYGIFTTGNNPYLINCLLNVYYPTHCIMYNNDEMSYICKKMLEEIGIEYESNFCNIKDDIFNFDKNNKFFLNNSQKVDIESALYISEFSDFEYNNTMRKIFDIKDDNNKDEYRQIYHNIKHKDQYKLNCDFNLKNKNISLQKSKIFTNIITQNPYITDKELKKNIMVKIIEYLRILCDKIKEFQKNNKSKYNYFTGEKIIPNANVNPNPNVNPSNNNNTNARQINDLNYKEIIENKNRKLNKNDVLRQLREHKNDIKTYSIKEMKKNKIIVKEKDIREKEKEKENKEEYIKNKILSIINTYSDHNIKNEWESMRKVWYQNNQRFNPIFKINDKLNDPNRKNNIAASSMGQNNNGNNTGNTGGQEGNNIFSNVQNVKTNQ